MFIFTGRFILRLLTLFVLLFILLEPILLDMVSTINQESIPSFLAPDTMQNDTKSRSVETKIGMVYNYATFSAVGAPVAAKPATEAIPSPLTGFIIER